MRSRARTSGFALTITLVLMVLIAIVVVAYLVSTRIERSTSSVYANRLRAKIQADSGLAAAIHLLKDNTRYGNYITAMPAPVPAPASIYSEIYRPTDPTDTTHAVKADDYLRLDNAAGEILASRATASSGPGPDVRPTPEPIPMGLAPTAAFTVTAPGFAAATSYDFNQIVTIGSSAGRLVQSLPNPPSPAYAQWVNVRDANSQLVGRYAFFVEDESMKVNVNQVGNNVGGSNMRVNDLSALPASTPASQIQEIDPSGILLTSRPTADTTLMNLGNAGSRLSTPLTLGLLGQWNSTSNNYPGYAHLATVLSEDDNTTARGWQRLDLNALASTASGNTAKVAVATRIANWIHDSWTGLTPVTGLQDYQMFGDDWLRKQIAANIVDYITSDNTPTDMGNVTPAGFGTAVPVIGFKKMPYLSGVNIVYQASGSTYPGSGVGTFEATVSMKVQFEFMNLYETALDLASAMGNTPQSRIELTGVPIIQKNNSKVYDVSSTTYKIKLSDLTAVKAPTNTIVPAGSDGTSSSGAKTFQTNWLDTQTVSFTVGGGESSSNNPKFLAQNITVKWIGNTGGGDYRLDDTAIVTSATTTKWCNTGCSGAAGDFLKESNSATRQIAAINYVAGYQGAIVAGATPGDPRYRGRLISDRWNFDGSRTDADPSDSSNRLDSLVDTVDVNCRPYGFDWFDNSGDRPLAYMRNAPMINIGELGNVATCEYPWRTIYFQYPDRPANTSATGPKTDIPQRRNKSLDYVLADIFKTQSAQTRSGAININTQQQVGTQQRALGSLFLSVPVGAQNLSQISLDRIDNDPASALAYSIANRRVVLTTPFSDNGPIRPFFQSGELASVLSRLVNASPGGTGTTGSPGRSTVSYDILRNTATSTTEKVNGSTNGNIQRDMQVEQLYREVSNSITTRGNVFRVLYVGQTIKDANKNGIVDNQSEVIAEYLGEAFVKRSTVFTPDSTNADIVRTSDSTYKTIANRVVTE